MKSLQGQDYNQLESILGGDLGSLQSGNGGENPSPTYQEKIKGKVDGDFPMKREEQETHTAAEKKGLDGGGGRA